MKQKGRSKRVIKKVHKFSSDDEEVESAQVKKNKVVKKSNIDLNFDDSEGDSEENSDFDSDRLEKEVQQIAVQNIATNYLNKKRDFPPLLSVDMEVSYSPIPTSKKAKLPSSTITKKSTVHATSESLSKPPLPTSGSNVDTSFQLFTDGTNGSPVSQIQLSQSSLQDAVSNVRSLQSPIISTNSPPYSQNQLSSTPIAHFNSLGSTSLPLPNQPTSASVQPGQNFLTYWTTTFKNQSFKDCKVDMKN